MNVSREVQEIDVLRAQVDTFRSEVARLHLQHDAALDRYRNEVTRLLRRLDAVRGLHDSSVGYCAECDSSDPCRTKQLARGEGGEQRD